MSTPSAEPISPTHAAPPLAINTWPVLLRVLWGAWAVLLLGGFAYGLLTAAADVRQYIPTFGRMSSSAVLVIAGGMWSYVFRLGPARIFALLIAAGMALGFIGDLFNAHLLPGIFPDDLMGGIVAFGIGHVAYIWGCVLLAKKAQFPLSTKFWSAVAAWQFVAAVGWWFVVMWGQEPTVLHWAALPYSLLLAGTAGVTGGLALLDRRMIPLALGGALFLVSDLILAFEQFRGTFAHAGDFVWLTYGPAQMLIVYACFAADRVLNTSPARPVH